MIIDLDKLDAGGFKLELPRDDGRPLALEITRAKGLRGRYAQSEARIQLGAVTAERLDLATFFLPMASAAVLLSEVDLDAPSVDLEILRGEARQGSRLSGRVLVAGGRAARFELDVGASRFTGKLSFEGLHFEEGDESGRARIRAERLSLLELSARVGTLALALGAVEVTRLEVALGEGGLELEAGQLELSGLGLEADGTRATAERASVVGLRLTRVPDGALEGEGGALAVAGLEANFGGTRVEVERATLPGGASRKGRKVSLPALEIAQASVEVPFGRRAEAKRSSPDSPDASGPLDLSFLDLLEGQLDIDLDVDAKVPILGTRIGKHRFRVPIRDGIVNYRALEHGLAALEDSILDFAVKDGCLILEKDIPLVPFDNETLVFWPLGGEDLALAQRELVRIRTLAAYKLPDRSKGKKKEGPPAVELRRLDFEDIRADLRLGGEASLDLGQKGKVRLGGPDRPALGGLRVRGTLRHRPEGTLPPTELTLEARALFAAFERLRLGRLRLDAGDLSVAALTEVVLRFEDLRPTSLRGALKDLSLRGASLTLPKPEVG